MKNVYSLVAFGIMILPVFSMADHAPPHSPMGWPMSSSPSFSAHGPPRHPLDSLRLELRQLCRDSPPRRSGLRLHGLPRRQRHQSPGNPDGRRLRSRPNLGRRLRNRAHRLPRRAADGADGQQHLLTRAVELLRTAQHSAHTPCIAAPVSSPSSAPFSSFWP
jgi:hypothetical protein